MFRSFQLICSVNPRMLKLSPFDDQIYTLFRRDFPTLNVAYLNEDEMKSPQGKEKWRTFINSFNKLEDYGYGSLIRVDASKEFSQSNSMLVVRIQFIAIEIARNREGLNDKIFKEHTKPKLLE